MPMKVLSCNYPFVSRTDACDLEYSKGLDIELGVSVSHLLLIPSSPSCFTAPSASLQSGNEFIEGEIERARRS